MNQTTSETRRFKLHPAMIYSAIHAQAGSFAKAAAELVCNSIDAGATRIDITLDNHSYTIRDDGRGFTSGKVIEDFFETFGQPHAPGDATYGRFRIGRGQAFSYSRSHWFSGCFEMLVDVKNHGMDYTLVKHPKPVFDGCKIVGELYEPLNPSDYFACERELRQLVAYVQIPVFLNGKQVNTIPSSSKWDIETDDAYIKLKATGTLKVYSLGVFVRDYSSHHFGCGGEVVSKTAFEVNTARNDILISRCGVWKRIRKYLVAQSTEKNIRAVRLDDASRQNLIMQFCNGEIPYERIKDAKIITLSGRQRISLERLSRTRLPLTVEAADGSRAADVLMSRKIAVVLSPRTLDEFGAETMKGLNDMIAALIERHSESAWMASTFRNLRFVEFSVLSSTIDSKHIVLQDDEMDKRDRILLNAIRAGNKELVRRLRYCREDGFFDQLTARNIFAGKSETAAAWTDGCTTTTVDLKEMRKGNSGLYGFSDIVLTLLHEYLHDSSDAGSHLHDAEFYERFHAHVFTWNRPVWASANTMFREYLSGLEKAAIRIPRALLQDADKTFQFGGLIEPEGVPEATVDTVQQ